MVSGLIWSQFVSFVSGCFNVSADCFWSFCTSVSVAFANQGGLRTKKSKWIKKLIWGQFTLAAFISWLITCTK